MSNINITEKSEVNISQKEIKKDDYLKEEIMKLKLENSKMRKKILEEKNIEKELFMAKQYILELNKEKYEMMVKQNEEIKKYKVEIEKLINEKDFTQINYNKRLTIFEQKMGKVNELEMENEVYKEELAELKEKNKKLEGTVDAKLEELEIKNQLKFKSLKNRVMKTLSETKENLNKLNLKNLDLKTKLIYLQNDKLNKDVEVQNKGIKKLINEKNELKLKLLDLENQNKINQKVHINLTNKLKSKEKSKEKTEDNNCIDINLFNKRNKIRKNKLKQASLIKDTKEKFLDSHIFNEKGVKENKIFLDYISKSAKKYLNEPVSKNSKYITSNNTMSKTEYNSINTNSKHNNDFDNLIEDKPKFKFRQIIAKKNYEIEELNIKVDRLKNRISFFINKYKKLYEFLEECLNTFFWEIKEENNYNIDFDRLSEFNFSNLNKKEKYGVLVLLMNHLLPIITFNFNSNCNLGNNVFKTNINIFDKTFNKTYKHLNEKMLYNSFLGKNNKIQKDLYMKNDILFNGSIPVLRKSVDKVINNYKLKDDKYKLIL